MLAKLLVLEEKMMMTTVSFLYLIWFPLPPGQQQFITDISHFLAKLAHGSSSSSSRLSCSHGSSDPISTPWGPVVLQILVKFEIDLVHNLEMTMIWLEHLLI